MDLAFSAGTLSTLTGVARADSSSKLQDDKYKEAIENAKIWLKSTVKKIGELERNNYEFLKHWLETDARVLKVATDFMKHMKNEMKKSYTLTKTQAANSRGLEAKARKPNAYPTLPATLEETVVSEPDKTEKWVKANKQTSEAAHNKKGMIKSNAPEDAAGQPPLITINQ